jgi:hypothetical protein
MDEVKKCVEEIDSYVEAMKKEKKMLEKLKLAKNE